MGRWTNFRHLVTRPSPTNWGTTCRKITLPSGNPAFVDPNFPQREGQIGVWGNDFATGRLVPPDRPDVMSYCRPEWISGYHFRNSLAHRLREETSAAAALRAPIRSLLLWGGEEAATGPYLEPAFVVDAMPILPDSAGGYTLTGHDARGRELFSVAFAMPAVADADEGAGGFVYTLPVRPG